MKGVRVSGMALLGCLAAAFPAAAHAHGTISPATAQRGATERFVVVIPNISINVPMTGFRLTPPAGVTVEPDADGGWSTAVEGRTVVWSGAGVPGGERGEFGFRARLPNTGAEVTFQGEESYSSVPRSGAFPLRVELTDEPAADPSSSDSSPVLWLVAGGVLVLAVAAAALLPRLRKAP